MSYWKFTPDHPDGASMLAIGFCIARLRGIALITWNNKKNISTLIFDIKLVAKSHGFLRPDILSIFKIAWWLRIVNLTLAGEKVNVIDEFESRKRFLIC